METQVLTDLYTEIAGFTEVSGTSIWDDLLSLIGDVVQKILNASIGANGKTIKDIIDDIKTSIIGTIDNVTSSIGSISTTVKGFIKTAVTDITSFITTTQNTITGKIDTVINSVNQIGANIAQSVTDAISGALSGIGEWIAGAINTLTDKINEVVDAIRNIGSQIGQWITNAISGISEYIREGILDAIASVSAFITDVIDSVREWLITAYNNIAQFLQGVIDTAKEWVSGIYENIKAFFETLINNLKDTYDTAKETVSGWIENAINWVKGITDQIKAFFWKTVTNVTTWISTNVMPKFNEAVKFSQGIYEKMSKAYDLMMTGNYQGAMDMLDSIFTGLGIPAPLEILHGVLSMIAYFWETVHLQFVPMEVAASKRANIGLALDPISNEEAANGVFRGLWGEKAYLYNASLGGVAQDRAKVALEASRPLPTPGQAQQLFLRGEITEEAHDRVLLSYGFSEDHIREIKSLYAVIPALPDIIRMAVREAFSPEIAQRFGQYEDLPDAFIGWAAKQGLSKEWAGAYWAAHWDLPSPQMGFEMFQRRIIGKDDLMLLLKALDVMPFWREKLIQLNYNPPTRVDVRRMYKLGMITEDQVYDFHLDIGYSPDNARILTEFTKRYSAPEDASQADEFANLARSTYSQAFKKHIISEDEYKEFLKGLRYQPEDIELLVSLDAYSMLDQDSLFDPLDYRKAYYKLLTNAYNRGLLNRDDIKPMLEELGLTDDQAELELNLIDYNREVSTRDTIVQQLHNQYVKFIITSEQLRVTMDTFNFYPDEVERLLQEWEVERSFRDNRPPISDLKKFHTNGYLTDEEYLDELRGIGYHERYIEMYQKSLAK